MARHEAVRYKLVSRVRIVGDVAALAEAIAGQAGLHVVHPILLALGALGSLHVALLAVVGPGHAHW